MTRNASKAVSSRIISLDLFRGLTVAFMILVNNPGDWGHIYPALKHAHWHGIFGADFVFPFFLFIVGVAIAISLTKYRGSYSVTGKILRRSVILFLLGIFLNGFWTFDWSTIRIPGVLQRIAIVYFLAACLFLFSGWRTILVLFLLILSSYWWLLTYVPVPTTGYTGYAMLKNYSAFVDGIFLQGHMWQYTKVYDPEGILSTFSALGSTVLGILCGKLLYQKKSSPVFLFFFSLLLVLTGYVWSRQFPLNKNLWTGSYTVFTGGIAFLILIVFHYSIDNRSEHWSRYLLPLLQFGRRALLAFFATGLFSRILARVKIDCSGKTMAIKTCVYENLFLPMSDNPYMASMLYGLAYLFLWIILIYCLDLVIVYLQKRLDSKNH